MSRDLGGSVPWRWLAGCLDCGEPHEYRPERRGRAGSWAADDGHAYRPRISIQLDEWRAQYRQETGQDEAAP